jgi:NAD(P)-dependent dehydrogenase (short-subunit alcohol dehydrogenase family)
MRLENLVALITGASRGLGLAIARALTGQGAGVGTPGPGTPRPCVEGLATPRGARSRNPLAPPVAARLE